MGNQQEIFDKGYIAGILDGEGTIHLSVARYKSVHGYKPATIYKPIITVGNTNATIIDNLATIYSRYQIPHYVSNSGLTKGNKKFYTIVISGLKRVPRFLEWFGDTPLAKRQQLETIREFIALRLRRSKGSDNGKNGYPVYGEKETSLYQRCKDLNQRVPQRLHVTRPKSDEDIVQTTAKVVD